MMEPIKTRRGEVPIDPVVERLCKDMHTRNSVPIESLQTLVDLCYKWGVSDGVTRMSGIFDDHFKKLTDVTARG